jgi:hypothetical protein
VEIISLLKLFGILVKRLIIGRGEILRDRGRG